MFSFQADRARRSPTKLSRFSFAGQHLSSGAEYASGGARVLAVAPSNAAADILGHRLINVGAPPPFEFVSNSRPHDQPLAVQF